MRVVEVKPTLYPMNVPWYATKKKLQGATRHLTSPTPASPARTPAKVPALQQPMFECPANVTSQEFANVIGSVMPVVAVDTTSPVTYAFDWSVPPHLDKIVQHYSNVTDAFVGKDKAKFAEIVQQVYAIFTQHDADVIVALLEKHHVTRWVWHGAGFCAAAEAVLEAPFMDLAPFVHALPPGVEHLQPFFERCGVRRRCSLTDVLQQVKRKYTSASSGGGGGGGEHSESEVRRDLNICVSILNELKSCSSDADFQEMKQHLVVPVITHSRNRLRLEPVAKCSFSDEEWVRQGETLYTLLFLLHKVCAF